MDPSAPVFSPTTPVVPSPAPPSLQIVPYGVEIPNRIFVGGCPYNMTELELTKFFSQFGEVKDAKIITDRDGGKSKGYGFITFATEEEASRVHAKGSLYYEQKKLNISKAVRKYGGQFQKANQEYVNGQRLLWLHPSGYLLSQHDGMWHVEQPSPHSQPVKPCYSVVQPPNASLYYVPQNTSPFIQRPHTGPAPFYGNVNQGGDGYEYRGQSQNVVSPTSSEQQSLSGISTITSSSASDQRSLESSTSSTQFSSPAGQEGENVSDLDIKTLEVKTKQLSLDSAYTSEADLDTSHSTSNATTAPNSGAASPKDRNLPTVDGKDTDTSTKPNSTPTSPVQQRKAQHYTNKKQPADLTHLINLPPSFIGFQGQSSYPFQSVGMQYAFPQQQQGGFVDYSYSYPTQTFQPSPYSSCNSPMLMGSPPMSPAYYN